MNVIEELWWRGMIHEIIPGTDAYLAENKIALYLGVDPTSDSMHIGNLVTVMMLVNFQKHGHSPVALVGGATGRVGDPSGKDKERKLLDEATLEHNVQGIRKQLESFLDFEAKENPARMINNYEWFQGMGFLEFLRDVGKHITISYMMNKESVKKRLKSESGISYTEFAYQLLQGYDFYHLYKEHGVKMQIGGSDQWGNITTGTELIRRMLGSEEKAYAAVCPLLTREDGSKFGKSADGKSIWLDPVKTSPYEFYQYWMQAADADAEKYIKIFTLKDREEVETLISEHQEAPHKRTLQKALAEDVTGRVHGKAGLEQAEKLTEFLFGRNTSPESLRGLSKSEWIEIAKVSDTKKLSKGEIDQGMGVLDFLVSIGVAKSKGEARRAIEKDKSIKINLQACKASDQQLSLADTFHGGFIHVQKGKKNKYIVQVD